MPWCRAAFKTNDPEADTLKAQILFCMIQGLGITYALYKLNGARRCTQLGALKASHCICCQKLQGRLLSIQVTYNLTALQHRRAAGMGLLPTHVSDFAAYFTAPTHQEYSSGVIT